MGHYKKEHPGVRTERKKNSRERAQMSTGCQQPRCLISFASGNQLLYHYQRVHCIEYPFKCAACKGPSFSRLADFDEHTLLFHKCVQCPFIDCAQDFPDVEAFNVHMDDDDVHQDVVACFHCNMLCRASALTLHIQISHGAEDAPSPTFEEIGSDRRPVRSDLDFLPRDKEPGLAQEFKCRYCTMKLDTKSKLEAHKRLKHAARASDLCCGKCGQAIGTNEHLQAHLDAEHEYNPTPPEAPQAAGSLSLSLAIESIEVERVPTPGPGPGHEDSSDSYEMVITDEGQIALSPKATSEGWHEGDRAPTPGMQYSSDEEASVEPSATIELTNKDS